MTERAVPIQAVVVGGGYIGLECAAALQLNGLDVTIVFPEDRFMERLFTPEIADFYQRFYADKGIHIISKDTVTAFEGEGKVEPSPILTCSQWRSSHLSGKGVVGHEERGQRHSVQ